MRIFVLTSSRADYGIYLPLLKKLQKDSFFELKIIAFGTHLSQFHGYTVKRIEQDGFDVAEKLETLILGDTEAAISNAIGNTVIKFSSLWQRLAKEIDLIIGLGDRYEMFAAICASVPFNLPIAHLHGGETTLGAIDDKFRHAITLMSKLHFTTTESYSEKVIKMIGTNEYVFNVGSLSLDNLNDFKLYTLTQFEKLYNIDLSKPTILSTLHPETVNPQNNLKNVVLLNKVFKELAKQYQIVITMPNADTYGNLIRKELQKSIRECENIIGVESFGTLGYFSCMKHCKFLLGNTSSGLIEAPSLKKYAINLGWRQAGRAKSDNVIDTDFNYKDILQTVEKLEERGEYLGENIYKGKTAASLKIIQILKRIGINGEC